MFKFFLHVQKLNIAFVSFSFSHMHDNIPEKITILQIWKSIRVTRNAFRNTESTKYWSKENIYVALIIIRMRMFKTYARRTSQWMNKSHVYEMGGKKRVFLFFCGYRTIINNVTIIDRLKIWRFIAPHWSFYCQLNIMFACVFKYTYSNCTLFTEKLIICNCSKQFSVCEKISDVDGYMICNYYCTWYWMFYSINRNDRNTEFIF